MLRNIFALQKRSSVKVLPCALSCSLGVRYKMNRITQEVNSLHRERELMVTPSVKRPRTNGIVTNDHSWDSVFDFLEFLTFWKPTDLSSSKCILQNNVILAGIRENEDIQDEKPYVQLQDMKLIITPNTKMTNADMLSSKVYCYSLTAKRHLLHLGTDEHLLATESDKLCSYLPDEAGEALVEIHSSKDHPTDTSSYHDSKWMEKLFKDKSPVFSKSDKDGRQVHHSVTQIQAFTHSSHGEEIICQPDCSHESVVHDAGFCNTWTQSAEVEVSKKEHIFSKNILFSKEEQEHNSSISCNHYADCKMNGSYPKEHMGNFVRDFRNEKRILQLQFCESENLAICDAETKGQVNENSMNISSILSIAECIDISVVPYDVAIARNTATENMSLKINDLCMVKGDYAAGKMILKGWNEMADRTTEAPSSARISQEPVKKDNNAGLYSVIDPAIFSETDKEAEEKHCNSASTAGVELSPSKNISEMEVPPPLCFDVRTLQKASSLKQIRRFCHQSITQQYQDDKEDLCHSYTEPKAFSITTSETHNMTGNHSSSPCNPTNFPPAGDERQECHSTVALQLKEQDQFDSFPNILDNVKTWEAEQSQVESSATDWIPTMKKIEDLANFKGTKADEHMDLDKVMKQEEERLQQNELHKEDAARDYISDWTEGEISDSGLTFAENKLEEKFELFSDHPYSAHVSKMLELAVEKERTKVKNVEEEIKADGYKNSETMIKSDLQQQYEHKTEAIEVSHVKCVSEWTENNMSASNNKLILVNEYRKGNKLSSCPDYHRRAETFLVENTDDLVTFTSSSSSDAIVPCQNDFSHSQTANSPTTLIWRNFPIPSACIQNNSVLGGFDTFEKIQLSPDDYGDNNAGLGNTSVITSFHGQLLKAPQQQLSLSVPEAASNKYHHQQALEEEEMEEELEEEYHTKFMANGFLNSDTRCSDVPDVISAVDVIALGWLEQQPNCEYTCDSAQCGSNTQSKPSTASTGSVSPDSDENKYPEFEMKKQFDMVLKELHLFFDISIRDFVSERVFWPKQRHDVTEPLETDCSVSKETISSAVTGCHQNKSTDVADGNHDMEVCGSSYNNGDGEQEVPYGSHMCPETFLYTADKNREPLEVEQRRKTWFSSFMSLPLLEQLSHKQPKRLEPLRTCTRPIRVGLSKKAKTKHLHRRHPYK